MARACFLELRFNEWRFPGVNDPGKFVHFFSHTAFIAVLVMAVTFPFSFAIFNIGILVVMVSVIVKKILARESLIWDPFLDGSILIFFAAGVISVTQTQHFGMSFQGVHKLLRYLLLFWVCRDVVENKKQGVWILVALLAGGAIAGLDGILQLLLGEDPLRGRTPVVGFESLIRITSSFPNTNSFAIYMGFILPLALALARYGKEKRLWWGGLFVLMALSVGLTYSRTAALAIGISILFLIVLKRDFKLFGGLILVIVLCAVALPSSIREWLMSLESWKSFMMDVSRNFYHQTAWNMITAHPWLGVGINTFDVNYSHFKLLEDPTTRWSAHQAYLQMAAETGFLGLFSFMMVLLGVGRFWRRAYRSTKDSFSQAVLIGMMAGLVAFLVTGFYESNLWQPRQTYFFWFYSGLMCAMTQFFNQQREKADGKTVQPPA